MTYYEIQNHHGEKIGETVYFKLSLARGVAKRLAGKWRKSNELRGLGMKIMEIDPSAIYGGAKTIEWVNT